MDLADVIRTAYERFNEKDFEGVVALFDPDVEWSDILRDGVTVQGTEALLQLWRERFSDTGARALLGDVLEVGEAVTAVVCYQLYGSPGIAPADPVVVTHRFTFRGGRVVRGEANVLDGVPDEVKALFDLR